MTVKKYTEIPRGFYDTKHNTFGGTIYLSDFDTDHCGSRNIASRIVSDWGFDQQCKQNARNRDNNKNFKRKDK